MDWGQTKDMLLMGLSSLIGIYVAKYLRDIASGLQKLTTQVAVLITNQKHQEVRIQNLEKIK
jgi:hypothetical protein